MKNISKEMLEISIQENLFTYNNKIYERLYNHEHKYRFFIRNNTDKEEASLDLHLNRSHAKYVYDLLVDGSKNLNI